MIYRISETGHFNISGSGKTALLCAEEADLYEAFNLLARNQALENLKNPQFK